MKKIKCDEKGFCKYEGKLRFEKHYLKQNRNQIQNLKKEKLSKSLWESLVVYLGS